MPQIPTPPSAEQTTGKTEALKRGSEIVQVLQSALQGALANHVSAYSTEEMIVPVSEMGNFNTREKAEEKARPKKKIRY